MSDDDRASGLTRCAPAGRAAAFAALLLSVACATTPPLSVEPVDPVRARRERQENAIITGTASESTQIVLRRADLSEAFVRDPAEAIFRLRTLAMADEAAPEALLALAELSFLAASAQGKAPAPARGPGSRFREGRRATSSTRGPTDAAPAPVASAQAHYLAAAVYAWTFLFGERESDRYHYVDRRATLATQLYNNALAAAFTDPDGSVELRAGRFALPWGHLDIEFDPASLRWGTRELTGFRSSSSLEVRGLQNRYRQRGIGAALVANAEPRVAWQTPGDLQLASTVVSATAVLVLDRPDEQVGEGDLRGALQLYRGRESAAIGFGGGRIPLEIEPSVALAATLEESGVWEGELSAFLGHAVGLQRPPSLFSLEPMLPGQTPVVFVHGTNSNPARWANMANDLLSDPRIRQHFGFWFFAYDSGNPILYSAMNLRNALKDIVGTLGSTGEYACLDEMVVIGHSQGGLLTKLMAIDSGTKFWDAISRRRFSDVRLRPETRKLLEEALFVTPLPFVTRIVFISTPHRGSFLASPAIVRRLAARLIQLPSNIVAAGAELSGLTDDAAVDLRTRRVSTSLDNMSPSNHFIRTLDGIPIAQGVTEHSIVAVQGDGPPESGNDGVVRFSSAHRPDADSELIVRGDHSAQMNPLAINEVERILKLQADESTCNSGP